MRFAHSTASPTPSAAATVRATKRRIAAKERKENWKRPAQTLEKNSPGVGLTALKPRTYSLHSLRSFAARVLFIFFLLLRLRFLRWLGSIRQPTRGNAKGIWRRVAAA